MRLDHLNPQTQEFTIPEGKRAAAPQWGVGEEIAYPHIFPATGATRTLEREKSDSR